MKKRIFEWFLSVMATVCLLFGVACGEKAVESVALNQTAVSLYLGETATLTAMVNPSDATNCEVVWSSSDEDVVSIDKDGVVTALAIGYADVTVTTVDGNKTATCAVTVNEGLSFDKSSVELGVNETETLVCRLAGATADNTQLVWSTSSASVATVADGVITGVGVGTATITAKTADERCAYTCAVTVVKRVESVALDNATLAVVKGATATLIETVSPSDATNKQVVWSSSNTSVATVANGVVTAKACGEATITVKTVDGEKTAQCVVTVYQPVTAVSLPSPTVSVDVGGTYQLTATVMPMDATNKTVFWSSDNACVTVSETGLISGISKGTATVTVRTEDGNKEISCTVTVNQPVTGVTLDKESDYIGIGGTATLTASVLPTNASNQNVTWASDDEDVATVVNGVVTGVSAGEARIIVTTEDGSFSDECTVIVLSVNIPSYMAVGQKVEKNADFTYTLASGTSLSTNGAYVTATANGTAVLNISAGSFSQDFTVKVIDFGNTTGTTMDLATNLSLWQYRNYSEDTDVMVTYENNVADGRTTPYTFNALKYSRPQNTGEYRSLTGNLLYLSPDIVTLAKSQGYQFLSFTLLASDNPTDKSSTTISVYNVNADGSLMWVKSKADPIYTQNIGTNWKRFSISLTDEKIFDGAGIGFGAYGKELYVTKVEFTGADISEYASTYFTESTTAGKSMDIVSQDLLGKMFTAVSNTATLTYATGGDKETAVGGNDYIKLKKGDYMSKEYYTYNQLRIEADWIQAAKKLGWDMIAVYLLPDTFGNFGTASYLKMGVGGKVYAANSKNEGRWKATASANHAWVSVDISDFEAGESLVIACSGAEIAVSGITLRKSTNYTAGLQYFNYDANIA